MCSTKKTHYAERITQYVFLSLWPDRAGIWGEMWSYCHTFPDRKGVSIVICHPDIAGCLYGDAVGPASYCVIGCCPGRRVYHGNSAAWSSVGARICDPHIARWIYGNASRSCTNRVRLNQCTAGV